MVTQFFMAYVLGDIASVSQSAISHVHTFHEMIFQPLGTNRADEATLAEKST
jgi:hypothetical protein